MCGIVAAASRRNIVPTLVEGLRRLEYRGYDSCGVAVIAEGGLKRARSVSRVKELEEQLHHEHLVGTTGIAHTRWATHGAPAVCNAHPHFSGNRIALVHNGIIENYEELREELLEKGYEFQSQTDTEVLTHYIHEVVKHASSLIEGVKAALPRLRGSYAIAVMDAQEPGHIVVARQGSPLVLGIGDGENFAASDAMAVAGTTDRFVYLEEGDVAELTTDTWQVYRRSETGFKAENRPAKVVHAYSGAVELGPYRHYMQKEIFEQPRAIADTLEGVMGITPKLFGEKAEEVFPQVRRLLFLACGTSYYEASVSYTHLTLPTKA